MAVNLDWGLAAQNPNVAGNYLRGVSAGNALREQASEAQMRQMQMNAFQEQAATRHQVGNALAGNDYSGAQKAAYGGGEIDLGTAIGKMSAEERAQTSADLGHLHDYLYSLHTVPAAQRAARVQADAPGLMQQFPHLTHDAIAQASADLSDGALQATIGRTLTIKEQLDQQDKADAAAFKRSTPIFAPAGSTPIFPPGTGPSATMQPGDVAASAPPPAPPSGAAPASGGAVPASFISALRSQESSNRPGVTGPDTPYGNAHGTMQVLDSTGQATAQRLGIAWRPDLMRGTTPEATAYQDHIGQAVAQDAWQRAGGDPAKAAMYYFGGTDQGKWGPKTHTYAQAILGRMGQSGSDTLAGGSGGDAVGATQLPGGWTMGAPIGVKPQAPPSGYRWNGDRLQAIPGGPADKPNIGGINGVDPAPNADPSATGPAALKGIPQNVANQVKAIAEGRLSFPKGSMAKSPYWQRVGQLVTQYDPTFNDFDENSRAKTRASFTSGKDHQSVVALNTALGHAMQVSIAADNLPNTAFKPLNKLTRGLESTFSGKDYNNFEVNRDALADELTRVFRGTGGSVEDVRAWKQKFDSADSGDKIKAAVREAVHLMSSRISALGDSYTKGMGLTKDGLDLLSPAAKRTYQRLVGAQVDGQGKPSGQASLPRLSPQQATSLKPGTHFLGEDGVERVRQ